MFDPSIDSFPDNIISPTSHKHIVTVGSVSKFLATWNIVTSEVLNRVGPMVL